jgi:putative transposase
MSESDQFHHRRSIRLPDYDYSQPGEYFITIVTHDREHLFGSVLNYEMHLNPLGEIARTEWLKTPSIRPEIELGKFIIMPNHFHAIFHILDIDSSMGTNHPNSASLSDSEWSELPQHPNNLISRRRMTLPMVIGRFKMNTAKRINLYRNTPGIPVWQRNYFEHIITSDREYEQIEAYIANNPANWLTDDENLLFTSSGVRAPYQPPLRKL